MRATTLLFVYNANSDLVAAMFDSAHKVFSPETYDCKLCALTYGLVGPRKEWTAFIKSLSVQTRFLHRDEFQKEFPGQDSFSLPAIFILDNAILNLVVDGKEFSSVQTLENLMEKVQLIVQNDP